ncbi:VWA domain-containing protein [Nocardioides sp. Root140]|uniref:VWA domain-containing protein n=1 Tax=Nocardioides sp. Root140 TaxID=1736460 RepID=UPI0012E3C789|nr:VWA domain-containing protein [Nocardioides sp. Root140]
MTEGGKRLIMRGLVRQVEQFLRLGYGPKKALKLVLWGDEATSHSWYPGDDVPVELFECKGSADGEALIGLLGSRADDVFLLLTDGFWPHESRSAIKRWKDSIRPDALRIIKVGADANPKLKGDDVFDSEDFFSVMDGWLDT